MVCAGFSHTMGPDANADLFVRLTDVTARTGGVVVVTFVRGRQPIASVFAVHMLVSGGGGDAHGLED